MKTLNRSLVLQLSLFGLAMGFGTVFVIGARIEPAFWLAIFVFCGAVIAKKASERPFVHGVVVGLLNGVWITATHVAFATSYFASHPQEAEMAARMSSPRLMMMATGPAIGLASGCVLGLFALVARRMVARRAASVTP